MGIRAEKYVQKVYIESNRYALITIITVHCFIFPGELKL